MLFVAKAAPPLAGAAGVCAQRQLLDQQRKPRLREFGGLVARVGHDVDGVASIGVTATARAAAQHLAGEERLAVIILTEEAGVPNSLLVRRHAAFDCLRHDARQQSEAAQQHERARIGGGRPSRRNQRALGREDDVEHFAHAFVDMDLGGALGRVGEITQNRGDPFDEKGATGIVRRPMDWPVRLRIGTGEVERDALAPLDHLQRDFVQLWIADTVVLDIIFPGIFAVGDLRQQLLAIDVAAFVENGLEAAFHRLASEAGKQSFHALRTHHASLHLAVQIGG